MTIYTVDDSQRQAAKVAGWAYLLPTIAVVFSNFAIQGRLITSNAAETARNILAHERLFRAGIACELIYCVGLVVLFTALYIVLKPVHRSLAMLATAWKLIYAVMWVVMTGELFDALRLLKGAGYLQAVEPERLQVLARLALGARFDEYYVGLLFYGLGSIACSALWLKSDCIPRVLGVLGVISSVWCVACTLGLFLIPGFSKVINLWWFDTPIGLFDIVTSFWLAFRGLRRLEAGTSEPVPGGAAALQ